MADSANAGGSTSEDELVRVARIGKPHGIKGDVTVQVFTDMPEERFVPGAVLSVREGSPGTRSTVTVSRARWNKHILVLGFEEFSDRNAAELHRNAQLFAAPATVTEDDGWYEDDLLDFTVRHPDAGEVPLGRVTGLITGDAQDLLEIALTSGETALIPFVEEIVPEIDEESRIVYVTPPDGLLELFQESDEDEPEATR
ncbi:ribosome maturation factor RimM [Citricoccus sp. NR2]|uniref:ribosome maturation factor RimM n=1 Tax=Citricoccus sp. NR2 TaxID=3004095 RepID=UPI0022DE7C42|nr:ribosome maturation factor RimM [Citricoccus sp. NR2]WBL18552.1 ribosome maturation factor RimM [Citricoccus sp. NR2]